MTLSLSPRHHEDGISRSLEASSSTSMSPPSLGSNVLAMLGQFQMERKKQEAKLARLQAKAKAQERALFARQQQDTTAETEEKPQEQDIKEQDDSLAEAEAWADIERLARIEAGIEDPFVETMSILSSDTGHDQDHVEEEEEEECIIDVDEWRRIVQEDFGQSQFWYSSQFAYTLARHLNSHLRSLALKHTPRIAFICSPTAFVAFRHLYGSREAGRTDFRAGDNMWVLEIDERFRAIAGEGFVRYDYNFPTKGLASLKGKVDMVVIDPPYLNKPTTDGIAQTISHLLTPPSAQLPRGGSILLITGDSIGPYACATYPLPGQPHLKRTLLEVEHQGGRLSNDFSAWGSWAGCETFGAGDGEAP